MIRVRERIGIIYGIRIIRICKKRFYFIFKLYLKENKIYVIFNGIVRL